MPVKHYYHYAEPVSGADHRPVLKAYMGGDDPFDPVSRGFPLSRLSTRILQMVGQERVQGGLLSLDANLLRTGAG